MARPIRVRISLVPGTVHNLYNEIVEAPPEGVTYSYPPPGDVGHKPRGGERTPLVTRLRQTALAKRVVEPALRTAPAVALRERLGRMRHREYDLYHSVGSVHPAGEPWVVQLESSLDFFSFGGEDWSREMEKASSRRYVERKLRACGFILPENEAGRRSVLQAFPGSAAELDAKMEVCPLAIRAGPEPSPPPPGPIRFLFVGSRNFPKDFVPKGGHLVLAAFRELRRRRNDVELTVRAIVPDPYVSRHAGDPGVTILDGDLPRERVDRLFEEHHAFVFPGSSTPGMVIREAFRAGRPAVTIDVWGNAELVEDGVTGLVAPPPHDVPYVNRFGALNWSHKPSFIRPFETNIDKTVAALADAMERLAADDALRRRFGENARREVVSGKFSIGERNKRLRRAYDRALGR